MFWFVVRDELVFRGHREIKEVKMWCSRRVGLELADVKNVMYAS